MKRPILAVMLITAIVAAVWILLLLNSELNAKAELRKSAIGVTGFYTPAVIGEAAACKGSDKWAASLRDKFASAQGNESDARQFTVQFDEGYRRNSSRKKCGEDYAPPIAGLEELERKLPPPN